MKLKSICLSVSLFIYIWENGGKYTNMKNSRYSEGDFIYS